MTLGELKMFSIYDGPDADCIVLSNRVHLVSSLSKVLCENEATLRTVRTYGALLTAVEAQQSINFVIIDLDSENCAQSDFDCLRQFRDAFPDKPTILLSDDFETNDYYSHLQVLGDVSLRVPVLHSALELALLQAPINNLNWRDRQRSHLRTLDCDNASGLESAARYQGEPVWHSSRACL